MESKLQDEQAWKVCGLGQGVFTCSYLVVSPDGFECLRRSDAEKMIEKRRVEKDINALGVNCSGPPDFVAIKETVN